MTPPPNTLLVEKYRQPLSLLAAVGMRSSKRSPALSHPFVGRHQGWPKGRLRVCIWGRDKDSEPLQSYPRSLLVSRATGPPLVGFDVEAVIDWFL